jgi:hypothetical protein
MDRSPAAAAAVAEAATVANLRVVVVVVTDMFVSFQPFIVKGMHAISGESWQRTSRNCRLATVFSACLAG